MFYARAFDGSHIQPSRGGIVRCNSLLWRRSQHGQEHLAAKASWEAANVCVQTYGGFAFASAYDVERKFRQTRLYQVAPISTNLILSYIGEHVLGLPRSY